MKKETIKISFIKRFSNKIRREVNKCHPRGLFWDYKYAKISGSVPVITRLGKDLRVRVWSKDVLARSIYVKRYHEPHLCKAVQKFIKEGMTVIDAGANLGQYTLIAGSTVGPKGQVHSFEPSPRIFRELEFNVELNNLKNICSINQLALSDRPGKANLSRYEPGKEVYGSLGKSNWGGEIIGYDEVDIVTIENYCEQNKINKVNFMKMDIEGAELFALKGAGAILKGDDAPTILMEIADLNTQGFGYSAIEIYDYLQECGYNIYLVNEKGKLNKIEKDFIIFLDGENIIASKNIL